MYFHLNVISLLYFKNLHCLNDKVNDTNIYCCCCIIFLDASILRYLLQVTYRYNEYSHSGYLYKGANTGVY